MAPIVGLGNTCFGLVGRSYEFGLRKAGGNYSFGRPGHYLSTAGKCEQEAVEQSGPILVEFLDLN